MGSPMATARLGDPAASYKAAFKAIVNVSCEIHTGAGMYDTPEGHSFGSQQQCPQNANRLSKPVHLLDAANLRYRSDSSMPGDIHTVVHITYTQVESALAACARRN